MLKKEKSDKIHTTESFLLCNRNLWLENIFNTPEYFCIFLWTTNKWMRKIPAGKIACWTLVDQYLLFNFLHFIDTCVEMEFSWLGIWWNLNLILVWNWYLIELNVWDVLMRNFNKLNLNGITAHEKPQNTKHANLQFSYHKPKLFSNLIQIASKLYHIFKCLWTCVQTAKQSVIKLKFYQIKCFLHQNNQNSKKNLFLFIFLISSSRIKFLWKITSADVEVCLLMMSTFKIRQFFKNEY